jgi:uncharacterized protein YjiS (DUF1127 family)
MGGPSNHPDRGRKRVMATTECPSQSSPRPFEKALTLVEVGARRLVAVWNAARNRRSVARLLEWDDRMLSDIGLTQGDVRSALSGRLTEDPTDQLGARYGERRYATRATARESRQGT